MGPNSAIVNIIGVYNPDGVIMFISYSVHTCIIWHKDIAREEWLALTIMLLMSSIHFSRHILFQEDWIVTCLYNVIKLLASNIQFIFSNSAGSCWPVGHSYYHNIPFYHLHSSWILWFQWGVSCFVIP